jgi:hypothetical protein
VKPIIHPDRKIGDSREIIPGNAPGERGPLTEIIRTQGGDERAQVLTVSIMGSGVFGSDTGEAPRGPLFATIEWGVQGARSTAEIDLPAGGVTFSVVASYLRVKARYDGLVRVNGTQLDPEAVGAPNPGPRQRVAAMVGYGSYSQPTRLTRTFRMDSIPAPSVGEPLVGSALIRRPAFARSVRVSGRGLDAVVYTVRFIGFDPTVRLDEVTFGVGTPARTLELPGDCAFVDMTNSGPTAIATPAFTFEMAF